MRSIAAILIAFFIAVAGIGIVGDWSIRVVPPIASLAVLVAASLAIIQFYALRAPVGSRSAIRLALLGGLWRWHAGWMTAGAVLPAVTAPLVFAVDLADRLASVPCFAWPAVPVVAVLATSLTCGRLEFVEHLPRRLLVDPPGWKGGLIAWILLIAFLGFLWAVWMAYLLLLRLVAMMHS